MFIGVYDDQVNYEPMNCDDSDDQNGLRYYELRQSKRFNGSRTLKTAPRRANIDDQDEMQE